MCASCVLFDTHLKHDLIKLEEGSSYIRGTIQKVEDKGILKKEFVDKHLLEIREYSLRLEKYRNDSIKKIEETFNKLISTLKKRKSEVISDLIEKFTNEREQIQEDEEKWIDKQEESMKVIGLSKDPDDSKILLNAKLIMDTIRKLDVQQEFKESKIYNVVDTSLKLDDDVTLSFEEILAYLKDYVKIEEPNILEFKS